MSEINEIINRKRPNALKTPFILVCSTVCSISYILHLAGSSPGTGCSALSIQAVSPGETVSPASEIVSAASEIVALHAEAPSPRGETGVPPAEADESPAEPTKSLGKCLAPDWHHSHNWE
jgi:hypothetical protein